MSSGSLCISDVEEVTRLVGIPIKVVGMSFHVKTNAELLSDVIVCERESDNPVDPFAVAVYSIGDGVRKKIGFLRKEIARQLLDQYLPKQGCITWKAKHPKLGILIEI